MLEIGKALRGYNFKGSHGARDAALTPLGIRRRTPPEEQVYTFAQPMSRHEPDARPGTLIQTIPSTPGPGRGEPTGTTRGKAPTLGHVKQSELQNRVLNITSFKITPICAYKLFTLGDGGKGPGRQHSPTVLGVGMAGPSELHFLLYSLLQHLNYFTTVIPSTIKKIK